MNAHNSLKYSLQSLRMQTNKVGIWDLDIGIYKNGVFSGQLTTILTTKWTELSKSYIKNIGYPSIVIYNNYGF
jgi:hypothetical protein